MIPPEEIAGRLARVRASMATGEIDALVVLAPDSQYWLCGLESFISGVLSQALLVPTEGETTLVMWDADEPLARETARADRIRGYRFGVDGAEIVGFDAGSRAVPHAVGVRLVEALAPARCGLHGPACRRAAPQVRVRARLPEPRRGIRRDGPGRRARARSPGRHRARARRGDRVRHAARAGSDYPSIPTELASGGRSHLVHGTPSHRALEPGDLLHVEIGGVEQRYNAVGLQTFQVGGAEPPPWGSSSTRSPAPASRRDSTPSGRESGPTRSRRRPSRSSAAQGSATASR